MKISERYLRNAAPVTGERLNSPGIQGACRLRFLGGYRIGKAGNKTVG